MPRTLLTMATLIVLSLASAASAQLRGAEAILRDAARAQGGDEDKPAAPLAPRQELQRQMAAYRDRAAEMPAEQAAAKWLAMFDRMQKLGFTPGEEMAPATADQRELPNADFQGLVSVLPPPEHWPALADAVAKRPAPQPPTMEDAALRLLMHTLVPDEAAQEAQLKRLSSAVSKTSDGHRLRYLMRVADVVSRDDDNPQLILEGLERQITALERSTDFVGSPFLPDLVEMFGEPEARRILRRVLSLRAPVEIERGEQTRRLATVVALETIEEMKRPRWELINSAEPAAMQLFEAMARKFDKPRADAAEDERSDWRFDDSRATAQLFYLAGLLVNDRAQDAEQYVRKVLAEEGDFTEAHHLLEGKFDRSIADLLHAMLSKEPALGLWDFYQSVAHEGEHPQRRLARIQQALARDDLPPEMRPELRSHLLDAQLRTGRVDDAAATALQSLEEPWRETPAPDQWQSEASRRLGLSVRLAWWGRLLDRPQWLESGLKHAFAAYDRASPDDRAGYDWRDKADDMRTLLLELERGADAERLAAKDLAAAVAPRPQRSYGGDRAAAARLALLSLMSVYHETGRPADVLALLDQAPWWGVADVDDLTRVDQNVPPPAFMAAKALADAGQREQAMHILDAVLAKLGRYDPAYQLLVQLGGQEAMAKLDELFRRDPFEERPLIWKAHLLREADKLKEAEQTIRRAIAIDPSDGEQPRGDRMRAYAVLADILDAKGDQKQAKFYRDVVAAIRMSEDADRLDGHGLYHRAIELYRQSLERFADAYCIQSRLAVQLSDLGRHEEAAEHYRRAYELMPDSFGRMESHCFGCEGVFSSTASQAIAEEVFQRIVREQPDKPQAWYMLGYLRAQQDKPQAWYMLGYLRAQQERYGEAAEMFMRAVELDPDYLNAWEQLFQIAEEARLPTAQRDTAALALARLDPRRKHTYYSLEEVRDMAALWQTAEVMVRASARPPESLYPLRAAKAMIDEAREMKDRLGGFVQSLEPNTNSYMYGDALRLRRPGDAIAHHSLVRGLNSVLQGW